MHLPPATRHHQTAAALTAAAVLALAAAPASADLFEVVVQGTADTRRVGGNSLLNLATDVADQSGQFAVFQGQAFTANFNYAGLQNAVVVTSNADNSVITLAIPSTGFSRTFDEADGDIEDQIEDFLKGDGAGELAKFIQVVNEQTLVGVTDGNPTAFTATTSNETFRLFGDFRNAFGDHPQGADGLRLYFNGGAIDTDVGAGYQFEGALTSAFRFTDHVGLVFDSIVAYRNIEDAETITGAFILGLPIKITPELSDDQPLLWQITPNFHIGGGGSADQLSGGLVLGGGVTNLLGVKVGDFFLSSGQHLARYEGQPIEAAGYEFETDVGQTVFKGSLALTYGGIGEAAFLQGGVVYTDFLDDAAVDNYVSPFAGVGIKLGKGVLRVGYVADLADGFTVHRGEAEVRFAL